MSSSSNFTLSISQSKIETALWLDLFLIGRSTRASPHSTNCRPSVSYPRDRQRSVERNEDDIQDADSSDDEDQFAAMDRIGGNDSAEDGNNLPFGLLDDGPDDDSFGGSTR